MRKTGIFFLFYILCDVSLWAQNAIKSEETDSIRQDTLNGSSLAVQALDEVVVRSVRVKHYTDHDEYFPTSLSKEHAAHALDLLSQMHIRGLSVDVIEKNITSPQGGNVQVRINDVISTVEDLQTILPGQVLKIDYITMPSVRYGQDISAVINLKVRRLDQGYALGINTMNAISTNYNDDGIWMKFNHRNSEFGLSYNYRLNGNSDVQTESRQRFSMEDGSEKDIFRSGKYDDCNFRNHLLTLSYNLQTKSGRMFSASFSSNWNKFPDRKLHEMVDDDGVHYTQTTLNKSYQFRPTLKLYYARPVAEKGNLSAYVTASHSKSTYQRGFVTDMSDNQYYVDGTKSGILAMLDFSYTFNERSAFSVGYRQEAAYTSNSYRQDEVSDYRMHDDSQYLYTDFSYNLKRLGLVLGMGVSRNHFSEASDGYTYWMARPKANLRYAATDKLAFVYQYSLDTGLPDLAQLTEFPKSENIYEMTIGNRNLQPYHTHKNSLAVGYDLGDRYFSLQMDCNHSPHVIADKAVNRENGKFIYSFDNRADYTHLGFNFYADSYFFNRKMHLYVMPYFTRDIVKGDYVHTNSHLSVDVGGNIHLGNFTIEGSYSSPKEKLIGETLIKQGSSTNIGCTYKYRNLSLKLGMRNVFNPGGSKTVSVCLSDIAAGVNEIRNKAFGNMVYLSLSWNLVKGRDYKSKPVRNMDLKMDDGIVR
ncbi:TonB-dependent receptor [uncultured Bacteroides sp.]|uniref:TonB-dependent receptor n=1 Tax=uncultured Bacteroides sp. TaxID=162156 RepID=UPI0026297CA2|nr:TonB-dependent receptor [uncultured Bacteroides sp.]